MAICQFYQRGTCKFGDSCRNEHPGSGRNGNGGNFGSASSNNRFGAFGGGDRYRPGESNSGSTFGSNRGPTSSFHVERDVIEEDLSKQRPGYPLSCYGPGKDAPRQLIEGPVEVSPEELRLRYYTLRSAGNEAQAQQEEASLLEKMESQVKAILGDIPGAIQYIEDGAKSHPNRNDIAKGNASTTSSTGAFGATQSTSAFGAASTVGQKPSPFGQTATSAGSSAFGKPAFGASGFGQPSMPGAGSAFGRTSSIGQASAFGQTSTPGAAAPFGQTNALGQKPSPFGNSGFGQSAFGQTSQPGANASPFGQQIPSKPSVFGQPAQSNASPFGQQPQSGTSPFGQQTASTTANPFAKPPNPFGNGGNTSGSTFGTPAFGQPANPVQSNPTGAAATGTAFGKPAFGQPANPAQPTATGAAATGTAFGTPAFGQPSNPSQTTSPFGQQTQQAQAANPFSTGASSQGSAFGKPAFGQASNPSPFGTQQNQDNAAKLGSPFGAPQASAAGSLPSPFGTQNKPVNPFGQTEAPAQLQAQSQLLAQAPANNSNVDPKERFKEGKPAEYEGEAGEILEEIYRRVGQLGRFNEDEEIPIAPPKCEWITPMPVQ